MAAMLVAKTLEELRGRLEDGRFKNIKNALLMKRESHHYHRDLVYYASIGFQFGISIVVGLALGLWLDGKFDTSPWLLLVGLGLGIAAGFRNLAIVIKRVRTF